METNRTVVVGLDDSPNAAHALRWAAHEARARGWALRLVHGLPAPAAGADDVAGKTARAAGEAMLAEAAARARRTGVADVGWTVVDRPAAATLVEHSEDAALLVVGARDGGARLGRGSDSVGAHVSRFARCPVVVVPPDAPVGSGTAEEDLLVVPAPDPGADLSSAELVELTTLRHAHCPVVFVRAQ